MSETFRILRPMGSRVSRRPSRESRENADDEEISLDGLNKLESRVLESKTLHLLVERRAVDIE